MPRAHFHLHIAGECPIRNARVCSFRSTPAGVYSLAAPNDQTVSPVCDRVQRASLGQCGGSSPGGVCVWAPLRWVTVIRHRVQNKCAYILWRIKATRVITTVRFDIVPEKRISKRLPSSFRATGWLLCRTEIRSQLACLHCALKCINAVGKMDIAMSLMGENIEHVVYVGVQLGGR